MAILADARGTLEAGLYDYLTRQVNYTGHAARPFLTAKRFDGMVLDSRNDARREFRSRVGNRVYLDRRPADSGAGPAVAIRFLSGQPYYGLAGESVGAEAFLELIVYCAGEDAARKSGTIAGLLNLMLSGYAGDLWGDVFIGECTLDGARTLATPPVDAGDMWTFTRRINANVYYFGATTPDYDGVPLVADIAGVLADAEWRLSAAGTLCAARTTIVSVAWSVSAINSSTPIVLVSGAPNSAPTLNGVTGTFLEPVISVATYSALVNGINVTVTITDSTGEVKSKTMSIGV